MIQNNLKKRISLTIFLFFVFFTQNAQINEIPYYEAELVKVYEVSDKAPLFESEDINNILYVNEIAASGGSRETGYPTSYMIGNSLFIRTILGELISVSLEDGLLKSCNTFSEIARDPGYVKIPNSNEEKYYYNDYTYSLLYFNTETGVFENCLTAETVKYLNSFSRSTYSIPVVINNLIIFNEPNPHLIDENLLVVELSHENGDLQNKIFRDNEAYSMLSRALIIRKEFNTIFYKGVYYPYLDYYDVMDPDLTNVTTVAGDIPYSTISLKYLGLVEGLRYYYFVDRILIFNSESDELLYRFAIHLKLDDEELISDFSTQTLDFHVTEDGSIYCFYCDQKVAALYRLDISNYQL